MDGIIGVETEEKINAAKIYVGGGIQKNGCSIECEEG